MELGNQLTRRREGAKKINVSQETIAELITTSRVQGTCSVAFLYWRLRVLA